MHLAKSEMHMKVFTYIHTLSPLQFEEKILAVLAAPTVCFLDRSVTLNKMVCGF